jgi:hypothetical protein
MDSGPESMHLKPSGSWQYVPVIRVIRLMRAASSTKNGQLTAFDK